MRPVPPDLTGIHVLLVDDNEDARTILGVYLRHLGATVTVARNGGDALAALNDVRAHVIVSDLSMPGMDGLELLTRIRSLSSEQASPTPAIAFTGYADRANQEAARAAGFVKFLPKPTDPLEIAVEIKRLAPVG
jgi:CheY-like chemotaxis protein